MKFGFEFNKKEESPRSGGEQRERSEDVIPARPELQNESLEDTFSKENLAKDPRKEFIPVEELPDTDHAWESYGEKKHETPDNEKNYTERFHANEESFDSTGEANPEVYDRMREKIISLIEENPDNFGDRLQAEIATLPPSEVHKVFQMIENMDLVTKTEDVVLDNEGNKIDLMSQDEDPIEDKDPRTALRKGVKIKGMPSALTFEEMRENSKQHSVSWHSNKSRLNFKTESDTAKERRNRGLLGDLMQKQTFEDSNAQEGRYDDEAKRWEESNEEFQIEQRLENQMNQQDTKDWILDKKAEQGDDYQQAA